MLTVAHLMVRNPIALAPGETLFAAAEALRTARISGAPVLDGDRLVGVVSLKDIVSWEPDWDGASEGTVSDVMTRGALTVSPDSRVDDAARRMDRAGVHRLVVTEGDRVVGILSASDVVRALAGGVLVAGAQKTPTID